LKTFLRRFFLGETGERIKVGRDKKKEGIKGTLNKRDKPKGAGEQRLTSYRNQQSGERKSRTKGGGKVCPHFKGGVWGLKTKKITWGKKRRMIGAPSSALRLKKERSQTLAR